MTVHDRKHIEAMALVKYVIKRTVTEMVVPQTTAFVRCSSSVQAKVMAAPIGVKACEVVVHGLGGVRGDVSQW